MRFGGQRPGELWVGRTSPVWGRLARGVAIVAERPKTSGTALLRARDVGTGDAKDDGPSSARSACIRDEARSVAGQVSRVLPLKSRRPPLRFVPNTGAAMERQLSRKLCSRGKRLDRGGIGSIKCARRLWRPIAPSTRHAIFHVLAFEIALGLRELRPVDIVESIDVHHRISSAFDHTRHDRNNSTLFTHVEIGGLCSESVLARLGRVGN